MYVQCWNNFFLSSLQNPSAPSPLGQMPPNDGMPGGPMPPGFFPVSIGVFMYHLKMFS